jgi:hypothetical protein
MTNKIYKKRLLKLFAFKHTPIEIFQYEHPFFGFDKEHEPMYYRKCFDPATEVLVKINNETKNINFFDVVAYVKICVNNPGIKKNILTDANKFIEHFKRFF